MADVNDRSRFARLNSIKLTAQVREHIGGHEVLEEGEFAGGAALLHGREAWVLVAENPERGLGGALAWAVRHDARALHLVADSGTGVLARRAAGFSLPILVWQVDGRTLHAAAPEALPKPVHLPEDHAEFRPVIIAAGAEPMVEHGVLAGEVWGLEVCRVVEDPSTGAVRLEVGVGVHDREAFLMLHGDRPPAEALAEVVRTVAEYRRAGGTGHPLNRLAQERALRARLVAEPGLIGATEVKAVEPPSPRTNLKDPVPCSALAVIDGREVVVVCSVGVDLDVVPYAVDARAAMGVTPCLVVLPRRDAIDLQRRLGALADPPIDLMAID